MKKQIALGHKLMEAPVQRQRGNAVLFTLLAMVIGGVMVAVGITQYQDAERAATVQSTVAEVNSIIGNAKQNFGQYGYKELTNAIAIGSRVIPEGMHQSTDAARNKFGGAVTLTETVAGSGLARLAYAAVPRELCTSIVNGTQSMAQSVSVGNTPVKAAGGGQVSIGVLNTQCSAGATVDIAWEFGRS